MDYVALVKTYGPDAACLCLQSSIFFPWADASGKRDRGDKLNVIGSRAGPAEPRFAKAVIALHFHLHVSTGFTRCAYSHWHVALEMSSQGRWSTFQHSQPGLPTILVRYVPTSIGYSIKLTDLSRVWEETVNVKEIIQRAEREGCSINPGDDSDQLCILLDKIDTALCRDEDGASAHVERANDPDNITLVITAPLPKPLAPLKWRIYLQQAGSEELTTLIVGPLLLLAHQQRNETEYLLEQLRHKDHVISKLLDRMESANLLLDSVFMLPPNVKISKRTPQRQQFAKHVPGLGLYEIGSELKHIGNIPSTDKLCNELGKTPDDHQNSLQAPRNGWWNHIEYGFTNAFKTEASLDLDGEDTDDDEFQVHHMVPFCHGVLLTNRNCVDTADT